MMDIQEIREGIAFLAYQIYNPDAKSILKYDPMGYNKKSYELADKILSCLAEKGACFPVEGELPKNKYPEDIFPTTIKEAGKLLGDRGLSDKEITAISGCLCRLGYGNALIDVKEADYKKVITLKEMLGGD